MKHFYNATLLLFMLITAARAQSFKPVDHWRAGSGGQDGIWDIAIDTAGNQYICGYFTGTVDIDPGPGVYNLTLPAGQTQENAFLLKLDVNGNFVWAKHFGGTVNAPRVARGVEVDQQGNVYVHGIFRENIRAESTSTLWTTNTTGSNWSPFLFKFSGAGVLDWGYGWNSSGTGLIWDVYIDSDNVFAGGLFSSTFDFNPQLGTGNVNNKTSAGLYDFFILKITKSGIVREAKTGGSTNNDLIGALSGDGNGNLYVSGTFENTVDFNFGINSNNLTSTNAGDCFILKIDTAFSFIWAKSFGGIGNEFSRKLNVKGSKILNYGSFYQTIDLDPSSNTASYSSNGIKDVFVQALDTSGNYLWGNRIGGTGDDDASGLAFDANNNLYLSGRFEAIVDFDPSPISDYYLTSIGGLDGFIVNLDSSGNFLAAASYGSSTAAGVLEEIKSTAVYANKNFVGGIFFNTIDINPSSLVTQNVTSAGQDDMLYMKLDACLNPIIQYWVNVCGSSYQLPSGSSVTQSGYYLDVVLSSQGCDSTNGITVNLFPQPDTTVTQTGVTFTAQPGLSYQWLNCQSGQAIAGATSQTYTATANGQYAVVVSNGNCTDTSRCIVLDNIGLHEASLPAINLYPNPTTGLLKIACEKPWQRVEVSDLVGRKVVTQPGQKTELDLSDLPAGIYLVHVHFEEGSVVHRVVKE